MQYRNYFYNRSVSVLNINTTPSTPPHMFERVDVEDLAKVSIDCYRIILDGYQDGTADYI